MEPQQGPGPSVQTREAEGEVVSHPNAPAEVTVEEPQQPLVAEVESGVMAPTTGLLQVTERRQPLSSVSSLEVHFDLLDLTELTDMSDQELAEVFADSDDENPHNEPLPEPATCVLRLGPGQELKGKRNISATQSCKEDCWTRSSLQRDPKRTNNKKAFTPPKLVPVAL
ncbi:hypothetical protein GDO78_003427 [Eleutherodactylus coqui]|uniref:Dysbindin domain-containing protein 1 n=1 Tax=Eleutherodactylus coqui TaxID=57060 RepID=A0A8J6ETA6_ELECQ|nr:hypothetical protein GDO78_003427 [Eleutherodactylus coqui]